MRNILITGGAGFIGSNLSLKLAAMGYNVTVMDILSSQVHGQEPYINSTLFQKIKNKVTFIEGTVTSKEFWRKAIKNQEIIIHLAAETGTGQSMYEIHKYVNVNVNGTAILLDLLTNESHNVRKIILSSSRAIYGEGKYFSEELGVVFPQHRMEKDMAIGDFDVKYSGSGPLRELPTDENSKIHPSSVYGITKQNQEQMIMTVCPNLGISTVIFRYQNVYGPGQSLANPYTGILSIFSTQIKNKNPINIFEDGNETRDFIYIDDVVDATISGVETDAANNEIFNVGSGVPTSVLNIANYLTSLYGIDVPIHVTGNYRLGDIRHNYADISKITNKLKFKNKYNIKSGLAKFVEWVDGQTVQKDNYYISIEEMKKRGLFK